MKVTGMQRGIWGAVIAFGGLLNGCAVLTIDVDVYKGSLINEEHVQMHQLLALATAAKPMLVQVRDALEWPEYGDDRPMYPTWHHQRGYVTPPMNITDYNFFKQQHARNVNVILSLYEDLNSPDLFPYGQNLTESLERLQRAKLNLEIDEEQAQEIYASIEAGLKLDDALSENLKSLKQAYKELLFPSLGEQERKASDTGESITSSGKQAGKLESKVGKLMDALVSMSKNNQLLKKKNDQQTNGLEAGLLKEWGGSDENLRKASHLDRQLLVQAVWNYLGEEEKDALLAWATNQLCVEGPQGNRACDELSKRTKKLADAYWDSRKAIREMWEESLSLLMRIERLEREVPSRYRALKENVIVLVVKLVSVRQMASALDRLGENCSVLENVLERELVCEAPNSYVEKANMKWTESNVEKNPERFEEFLRQELSASPADMTHFLLGLDSLIKEAFPPSSSKVKALIEKANKGTSQRVVRLGLDRGSIDDDGQHDLQGMSQTLNEIRRYLAQGFERGRSFDGIHTLTENYLQTHDHAAVDDEIKFNKLLDALVEFAQKILFLANHEGLTSPPGISGLLLGGGEKVTRGLFGDWATKNLTPYRFITSESDKAKNQQYVRVLQAVGNSILFSANELRERDRHRKYGLGKVQTEVSAVNLTHTTNPKEVMDDLLEELKAEKDIVDQKVSDARIRKTILEKELADLIATQKPALTTKQATAEVAVTTAQANLTNFQATTKTLKALYHVLIAERLNQEIPKAWGSTIPNVATTECLLKITQTSGTPCPVGPDSIEVAIKKEMSIKWPTLTKEQEQNYNDAIDYVTATEPLKSFENYRQQKGLGSMKVDVLLKDFTDHVQALEQKRNSDEQGLIAQVDKANNTQTDYQKDIARANSRVEIIQQELSTIEGTLATHPIDSKQIESAIQEIAKLTDDVRKQADATGMFLSAKEIYEQLEELSKKREALASPTDKQKFKDVRIVLERRMPPSNMTPLDPEKYKSPQEVMDQVIALFRHRQLEAVERFGTGSEQDKKAMEALESAYQHRAGMIYIRPSSAYLRTSFPSTSLQDDPNLAWDNMLLQQGIRNLPFSSELRDILDPSVPRDRLLTSELDKQYWQNINRVRVSGTGFTNQVVAKDDVGNWYVKQYYGDTEDIVKSAKHLALFNLGTKLPIDLAGELKAVTPSSITLSGDPESDVPKGEAAPEPAGDTKAKAGADSPPLNRVLEKHRKAYYTKTTEASMKLDELHTKNGTSTIHDKIVKSWEKIDELKEDANSMDALKATLGAAIQEWDEAFETLKKKTDQDQGQLIVKDLRALSRVEKMLSLKTGDIDKEASSKIFEKRKTFEDIIAAKKNYPTVASDELSEAQKALDTEIMRVSNLKTKAKDEVNRIVGNVVLEMLEERKQTLDNYEQAILFIGDATNSKNSLGGESN